MFITVQVTRVYRVVGKRFPEDRWSIGIVNTVYAQNVDVDTQSLYVESSNEVVLNGTRLASVLNLKVMFAKVGEFVEDDLLVVHDDDEGVSFHYFIKRFSSSFVSFVVQMYKYLHFNFSTSWAGRLLLGVCGRYPYVSFYFTYTLQKIYPLSCH